MTQREVLHSPTSPTTTIAFSCATSSATGRPPSGIVSFPTRSSSTRSSAVSDSENEKLGIRDYTIRVAKMPMTWVARALETDQTRGVMKAVIDAENDRILGFAMLGMEGGEIAGAVQIAMMGDLPYTVLRDGVFSHPTLMEALNNLFSNFEE